jgi:hemin uptake protein HemP
MKTTDSSKAENGTSSAPANASRRVQLVENRLDSRELFASGREITIGHAGEVYRLRLTSQNKLILTK